MTNDFFELDESKCVKCGACVRDCAFKAIRKREDGAPEMRKPERCMKCQHCFAVCPTGAITFDGHAAGEARATRDIPLPSLEELENWMRTRRSIRQFSPNHDVDPGTLDRILKALGNSPTGCNARGLTFHCFPNRASLDSFREQFVETLAHHKTNGHLLPRWLAVPAINLRKGGEDIFFRGASGLIVISTDEKNPALSTPVEDTVIACSNFELLANAAGIGTCWFGFLRHAHAIVPEFLGETLGISPTASFYSMLFGIPAVRHPRAVVRDSYARVDYR